MGHLILLQQHWGAMSNPRLFVWKLAREIIRFPMYYAQFKSLYRLFEAVNYKIIKGLVFDKNNGKWERYE